MVYLKCCLSLDNERSFVSFVKLKHILWVLIEASHRDASMSTTRDVLSVSLRNINSFFSLKEIDILSRVFLCTMLFLDPTYKIHSTRLQCSLGIIFMHETRKHWLMIPFRWDNDR